MYISIAHIVDVRLLESDVLVFTNIGPVFSGREMSGCRDFSCNRTCVGRVMSDISVGNLHSLSKVET